MMRRLTFCLRPLLAAVIMAPTLVHADCPDWVREACVGELNACLREAVDPSAVQDRQACWDALRTCLQQQG
jgi:hypothetical protein